VRGGGQMTIETERMPTRNAASQWLMTRRDCPGEEGACEVSGSWVDALLYSRAV